MCYKYPGPRCSHHATLAYQRARTQWDEAEAHGTDLQKFEAMEKLKKAEADYDMTPVGQQELQLIINMGFDREGKCALRLERGKVLRAAALAQIKSQDKGDIDNHSLMENIEASIPVDEGFPRQEIIEVIRHHVNTYGSPLGSGRNRVVFDRGDGTIVKIPKNWDGELDNSREASWNDPQIPLADCRSEPFGPSGQEINILVMEKVTPVEEVSDLPNWINWVDCQQVGYTADHRLVAYDL